jgi:hypothetical protein
VSLNSLVIEKHLTGQQISPMANLKISSYYLKCDGFRTILGVGISLSHKPIPTPSYIIF